MSSSDDRTAALERLVADLAALAADAAGAPPRDPVALGALLTQAVRLYAGCSENPYGPAALAELKLTPTEACTVAAALLHSQSLTPFEFAVWFSNSRVNAVGARGQDEQEQR